MSEVREHFENYKPERPAPLILETDEVLRLVAGMGLKILVD